MRIWIRSHGNDGSLPGREFDPSCSGSDGFEGFLKDPAVFEGLIARVALSLDVGNEFSGQVGPVAERRVFDVWQGFGDVFGKGNLFPFSVSGTQVERAAGIVARNVDGCIATVKGYVVGVETGMDTAVFEQGRNGLLGVGFGANSGENCIG